MKSAKGRMVMLRDQMADLAWIQGYKVTDVIDSDAETFNAIKNLLPTPNTMEHLPAREGEARERQLRRGGTTSKRKSSGNLREDILQILLPTPAVGHVRNHDEPIDDYLQRRQDYLEGRTKGMPGASLGVAVRMQMLPTPAARDHKDGTAEHERDGVIQTDTVARAIINSGEVLLGTPRANAATVTPRQIEAGAPEGRIEDQVLTNEVALLGTVTTATSGRSPEFRKNANPTIQEMVDDAKGQPIVSWGKYEPAIRRWEEITGRPAPAPTLPDGKDGAHRLSPWFTEWMMGLPAGWICDETIGIKRNMQLKAAGNGVVPQQAHLALQLLGIQEILGIQ